MTEATAKRTRERFTAFIEMREGPNKGMRFMLFPRSKKRNTFKSVADALRVLEQKGRELCRKHEGRGLVKSTDTGEIVSTVAL